MTSPLYKKSSFTTSPPVSRKRKTSEVSHIDTTGREKIKKFQQAGVTQKKKTSSSSTFNYIYDRYTQVRGAPKMLEITCRKCHAWVMDYQKDGPGRLLRCYVDRIYHPSILRKRVFIQKNIHKISPLKCLKCGEVLARPFIYKRRYLSQEIRPSYVIIKDASNRPAILFKERIK